MTEKARSLTTVNEDLVENAVHDYTVSAVDGGDPVYDWFSMTLYGGGLMLHEYTFEPQPRAGLVSGDIVAGR